MSDCPHCRRFREERDEAIEALRQAKESASGGADLAARIATAFRDTPHQVTKQEARVLAALYASPVIMASTDELITALRTESETPDKLLNMKVTHIRKAGFAICCIRGFGYVLADHSRAFIRDALARQAAE